MHFLDRLGRKARLRYHKNTVRDKERGKQQGPKSSPSSVATLPPGTTAKEYVQFSIVHSLHTKLTRGPIYPIQGLPLD